MKRIIIKYKIAKRNLYRRFYQKLANMIIVRLENTNNENDFDYLLSLGYQLDFIAKGKNIYLK